MTIITSNRFSNSVNESQSVYDSTDTRGFCQLFTIIYCLLENLYHLFFTLKGKKETLRTIEFVSCSRLKMMLFQFIKCCFKTGPVSKVRQIYADFERGKFFIGNFSSFCANTMKWQFSRKLIEFSCKVKSMNFAKITLLESKYSQFIAEINKLRRPISKYCQPSLLSIIFF